MKLKEFDRIKLKDGREATVMDTLGSDYIVDVGEKEEDFETIIIKEEEIEEVIN